MRFRLGNEIEGSKYWEKKDNKICRLCGGEMETWKYVREGCRRWTAGGEG